MIVNSFPPQGTVFGGEILIGMLIDTIDYSYAAHSFSHRNMDASKQHADSRVGVSVLSSP